MTAPTPRSPPLANQSTTGTASSSVGTVVTRKTTALRRPRSRNAPYPNSVLDRKALIAALENASLYGSTVRPVHISSFYQALHRQHYPDLDTFVTNYYKDEEFAIQSNTTTVSAAAVGVPVPQAEQEKYPVRQPLKNKVSTKKNRNKMQLPKAFLDYLKETKDLVTVTSTVAQRQTSADQSTTKLAVRLHDGQLVESVLMRYIRPGTSGNGRASLCVSSQCGCAMGCTFCATGTMGLSGNLTTGEILEQIVHADRILAEEWHDMRSRYTASALDQPLPKLDLVRNVVFMGMGEPLDNYNNVVEACRALIDNKRWNLAYGRVTVSTVGIIDKIRKLTEELPEVSLALSLHAPNQAMRSAIVPTAKHFPIEQLVDALDGHMMTFLHRRKRLEASEANPQNGESTIATNEYTVEERIKESTRRRAMIEYVMLEGETSTLEAAHQLGKLCEGRQLIVNLIPYNQTDVKDKLRCPSEERVYEFRNILTSYGTFCTIRRTMGADIDSACGQLITLEKEKSKAREQAGVRDIEDVASNHSADKTKVVQKLSTQTSPSPPSTPTSGLDLEPWIRPLAVATTIAASCFVVTTVLFLKQRRRS